MKFILWTFVWFLMTGTGSKWIGIAKMGTKDYYEWHDHHFSDGIKLVGAFIEVFFWIYLYIKFIQ